MVSGKATKAPAVYRPQPTPKCLQLKPIAGRVPAIEQVSVKKQGPAGIRENIKVAQRKTNNYQARPLVNRTQVTTTFRGMPSGGTVQRAEAKEVKEAAPQERIFFIFNEVRPRVLRTLKKMQRIPEFQELCARIVAKEGRFVNIIVEDLGDKKPAYFKPGKVFVDKSLNHDEMVNAIVLELANLSQGREFDAVFRRPKAERPGAFERLEFGSVNMQNPIMEEAVSRGTGRIKTTRYGHLLGPGKPWETFEGYAESQRRSGHTSRYEDDDAKPKPAVRKSRCRCFITSACVLARGLPDDCEELTTLRSFRDNYIMNLPGGLELIREYYQVAPGILERIYEHNESERILTFLYEHLVLPAVKMILKGEDEQALTLYRNWVAKLMNEQSWFDEATEQLETTAIG